MTTSGNFSLKWKDHQENLSLTFKQLEGDIEFSDVTLVVEDGQLLYAHKIILSAASPFFRDVLKQLKTAQPVIYMRGTRGPDLAAVMSFLYCGEVEILEENLESFFLLAQQLQLKGLTGVEAQKPKQEKAKKMKPNNLAKSETISEENLEELSDMQPKHILETVEDGHKVENENIEMISDVKEELHCNELANDDSKKHAEDLKAEIMFKMEKLKEGYKCNVCGKLDAFGSNMRNHVESLHVTGFTHACNECGMTKASRNALRLHRYKMHKS